MQECGRARENHLNRSLVVTQVNLWAGFRRRHRKNMLLEKHAASAPIRPAQGTGLILR